jgi:hypothetical protein
MTTFVVRSHNQVLLYSLMTSYHRIFDECNTTDATRPEHLIPQLVFVGALVARCLVFCKVLCESFTCIFVHFILASVLSDLPRLTASV